MVGLGIEQAVQWKDIVNEAVKAGVVFLVLDGFNIMAPVKWLEEWMDLASVQARMENTTVQVAQSDDSERVLCRCIVHAWR